MCQLVGIISFLAYWWNFQFYSALSYNNFRLDFVGPEMKLVERGIPMSEWVEFSFIHSFIHAN